MNAFCTDISGPLAVIGDVYGQAESLRRLLNRLRSRPDWQDRWIVFVGDFVDRGPDPRGAIETVIVLRQEHARTTTVMGNHDLAAAGALGLLPVPAASHWPKRYLESYNSGRTFSSYGVPAGDLEALAAAVPASHKDFLAALPWAVFHPAYLIVHAGLLPNVPYDTQTSALRRPDFKLNKPAWLFDRMLADAKMADDCGQTVVSGHVAVPQVTFTDRRIFVDTTGGVSGVLSAVLLPEMSVVTSC